MPTHVKLIITPLEPFFASIRVAINPKYPAPTAESPLINAFTACHRCHFAAAAVVSRFYNPAIADRIYVIACFCGKVNTSVKPAPSAAVVRGNPDAVEGRPHIYVVSWQSRKQKQYGYKVYKKSRFK